MAEISREDAIKVLSTYNCVDCGCGSSQVPTTQCICTWRYVYYPESETWKEENARIDYNFESYTDEE